MRKVIVYNSISVDGYFSGPHNECHWLMHDPDVSLTAHEWMNPDTILFGRHTYQLFESYWPHILKEPDGSEFTRKMAELLSNMRKIVFSTTLHEVSWDNTILRHGGLIDEVQRMKTEIGKDIIIIGSGTLIHQLAEADLVDEYVLGLTPLVLGAGKPLIRHKVRLKLQACRTFPSGIVLLHYSNQPFNHLEDTL